MSLDRSRWIYDALGMGQQIDSGCDISLSSMEGRACFKHDVGGPVRAEFSNRKYPDSFNQSFSYHGSLYLPSYAVDISDGGLVLMQWHGIGPGARLPLSLQLQGGVMFFNHQHPGEGHDRLYECSTPYDRWIDFDLELQFGRRIAIAMDGVQIVNIGEHERESSAPYFKFGAYRTGKLAAFPRVTVYWSDVRRIKYV